jgi:GNAT superfamily N-acetyltransferase
VPELNAFLKEKARPYIKRGLCAVHVFSDNNAIAGYYTLSASSVKPAKMPPEIARKYPRSLPVPCWILGRLAVDKKFQGQGIGEALLMAACGKVLEMSQNAGGWCLIVDAKDEKAKQFYLKYGFQQFPESPLRLYLPLSSIRLPEAP